jgi:hypothetical protein
VGDRLVVPRHDDGAARFGFRNRGGKVRFQVLK